MGSVSPVYIDGPLRGREFTTPDPFPVIYAADDEASLIRADTVCYQMRKFGFHCGGKAVLIWIAWCGPAEPDAEQIARAMFTPEAAARMEVRDV